MEYIALYRKFRPLKFSDMVGQDHISQILKNQIINNRVGHAYLFSGIRGTGKTSSAKIFARAINCLNPQNGEPCNECEICKSILSESLTDVTEIDAASNNGVDNIRDIREEVMYLPTKAKYRIYIIDEVHMLSSGAFNALLKTLEEPPKHVKFILATTEPNKLPATILSRCQRFDFKRISNNDIVKKLKEISQKIEKQVDESALNMIAQLSEGALRDAISIFDRCVSDKDVITKEYITELVGALDGRDSLKIIENIIDNNSEELIINIEAILANGKNISLLLTECIRYLQNILIYMVTKNCEIYSDEEKNIIDRISKKVSVAKITELISAMSQVLNDIKWSSNQNIVAQAGLIRLCLTTENDGLIDLKRRIEKLENNSINLSNSNKLSNSNNVINDIKEKKEIEPKNESIAQSVEKKSQDDSQKINTISDVEHWKDVLTSLRDAGKINLYANLINADVKEINHEELGIYFKVDFAKTMVEKSENIETLKKHVLAALGKNYEIRCFFKNEKKEKNKISDMESTAKKLNIPMDIVDE